MTLPLTENRPPGRCSKMEERLDRFESAWQKGPPPAIEDYLSLPLAEIDRRQLLIELIKTDLEYVWSKNQSTHTDGPSLEDYGKRFCELGPPDEFPLELIAAEFRVRSWAGRRPTVKEFATRFGERHGQTDRCLEQITEELSREALPPAPPKLAAPVAGGSVAELLDALRHYRLLGLTQLNELILEDVRGRFPDSPSAARYALDRGWLTSYQVELLLNGRGNELVLGLYLLLSRLGEGASGVVFKARHRSMNRLVALKVFRPELLRELDADALRRFYQEMRAVGQLSHPHVVHAYDAGPAGSLHFLAMEYCEGIDLAHLLRESGPFPVQQACSYIRQAALGLEHAWQQGLVHRDVKPGNLFLARSSAVKGEETIRVLDFGLARLHYAPGSAPASTLTRQTDLMGTADYMAPEQASDPHQVDTRADLYGLGCTFYHLLAGKPPFPGGTFIQKLEKHRWEPAQPIEQVRPDTSPEVAAIVRKLMAKRPEDRFQTPTELLGQLTAVDNGAAAPPAAPVRLGMLSPLAVGGGLAAALAALLILVLISWSRTGPTNLGPNREVPEGLHPGASAEAECSALVARDADPRSDRAALRADVMRFRRRFPGTPEAVQSGTLLERLPSPLDVLSVSKLTDEQRALVGNGDRTKAPPQLVAVIGDSRPKHPFILRTLAFAPEEPRLAVGSPDDYSVQIWDVVTGKKVRVLAGQPETDRAEGTAHLGHTGEVFSVAFHPEGKVLATASRDFTIKLWDVAAGRVQRTLRGHQNMVTCLAFSPDGKTLASGSHDHTVKLWDVASEKERETLRGHSVYVTSLAFSPDGDFLVSGSDDRTVQIWDNRTGRRRSPPLVGQQRQISGVSVKSNSKIIASSSHDGSIKLWDAESAKELRSFCFDGRPVTAAIFSPVGGRLAMCSEDGTLRIIDTSAGAVEQTIHLGLGGGLILQLAFSPDGRYLATANVGGTVYILRLGK